MNILGLHFGHDGAACILRDGRIAGYALRERHNRVKHALGVSDVEINRAIEDAGIEADDIDRVAITSTQNMELLTEFIDGFDISLVRHPDDQAPATLPDILQRENVDPATLQRHAIRSTFLEGEAGFHSEVVKYVFPEGRTVDWSEIRAVGWIDNYITADAWERPAGLDDLAGRETGLEEIHRLGLHLPVTVRWRGRALPGIFVQHHMAHAAACFFRSGFDRAAVITHDGFASGESYHGGLFALGDGNRLWPMTPHHMTLGVLYEAIAALTGVGDAGKLMGQAPYGDPHMFESAFAGNEFDIRESLGVNSVEGWRAHCRRRAGENEAYDLAVLGDAGQATEPVNADVAASTQRLFEESYLAAVRALARILERQEIRTDNLCLSGGTALNCPSNSRIWREGPFQNVFVEPSCDDGGIAIGAALHLYHNLLDHQVVRESPYASPYLGGAFSRQSVRQAIEGLGDAVRWQDPDDAAAADDLVQDRVVAWFEGRSEAGPRALGHRSILADARPKENWLRVNRIKGREPWRPFAPIVLAEKAGDWFEGCPLPSPYMLFTAGVKSDRLPAITHVDGSSRIQTVDESCGDIYRVLQAFDAATGVPVLMNTSFNGPGEPIIETPEQALAFLLNTEIDAVYIEGYRIERAAG